MSPPPFLVLVPIPVPLSVLSNLAYIPVPVLPVILGQFIIIIKKSVSIYLSTPFSQIKKECHVPVH